MQVEIPDIQWLRFNAMGSPCEIGYVAPSDEQRRDFEADAVRWVRRFEARYSRYSPASLISRINDHAGGDWVDIDPETEAIFALVDEAHRITEGIFDPSSLPLLRIWDYKKVHDAIPDSDDINHARELMGWSRLERRSGSVRLPAKGMGIDVGGICKEYAVDQIVELALQRGIDRIIVNFGQDIRVQGDAPGTGGWRIGLENPFHPGTCWTALSLAGGAVASSGAYYRNVTLGGKEFGHMVDIRTGYPAKSCCSVTTVASSCWFAGVLSTAAYILGPEEGLRLIERNPPVEACILTGSDCFSTGKFALQLVEQPQH